MSNIMLPLVKYGSLLIELYVTHRNLINTGFKMLTMG